MCNGGIRNAIVMSHVGFILIMSQAMGGRARMKQTLGGYWGSIH